MLLHQASLILIHNPVYLHSQVQPCVALCNLCNPVYTNLHKASQARVTWNYAGLHYATQHYILHKATYMKLRL